MNTPFYISGRDRTNPPNRVSPTRYQFLSLKDAEPNLGVPLSNALPASATWVLTTDALGNRYFSTTLLYDSTYSTFKGTSADFVSVFTTVQHTSANWQSTYTTLNTNSGTWLTVTSANSLYSPQSFLSIISIKLMARFEIKIKIAPPPGLASFALVCLMRVAMSMSINEFIIDVFYILYRITIDSNLVSLARFLDIDL